MSKTAQDKLLLKIVQEKIFDLSPEAILIVDSRGKIVRINEKVVEWLGYVRSEIEGESILINSSFITKKGKVVVAKKFAKRMLGGKVRPYEVEFMTKTKEMKIGRINGTLIRNSKKKILGILVIVVNVTDQHKLEEEGKNKAVQMEEANELMVGRELKMIELKMQVAKLQKQVKELQNGKKTEK